MFNIVFVRSFSHYSHLFLKRLSNLVYIYLPKLFLFLILAPMEILWKQGNFCSSFVSNFWIQSFNAIFGQSQERMRERIINGHFCIGHTRTYWLDCNLHTRSSLTHTHTHTHTYTLLHTHTYTPLHTHAYTHILSITHYSFVQTSAIVSRLSCICFHSLFLENFVGIFETFWVNWIFWIIHDERKM